jgi:hypothetical protein
MEPVHRTLAAVRRLAERIRTWRDEIATYEIDADRWLR